MDHREQAFMRELDLWADASTRLVKLTEDYRVAHATAFTGADGTDSKRKSAADAATSAQRTARDTCEVEERKHYHRMIFLRGSAGERERT